MAKALTGQQAEQINDLWVAASDAGLDFSGVMEALKAIIGFVTSDEFTKIIDAIRSLFAKLKPADGKAGSILTIVTIIGTLMTLLNSDAAKQIIAAIKAMLDKRRNGEPVPVPDGFPPAK